VRGYWGTGSLGFGVQAHPGISQALEAAEGGGGAHPQALPTRWIPGARGRRGNLQRRPPRPPLRKPTILIRGGCPALPAFLPRSYTRHCDAGRSRPRLKLLHPAPGRASPFLGLGEPGYKTGCAEAWGGVPTPLVHLTGATSGAERSISSLTYGGSP
jgi:hypothetical protein